MKRGYALEVTGQPGVYVRFIGKDKYALTRDKERATMFKTLMGASRCGGMKMQRIAPACEISVTSLYY